MEIKQNQNRVRTGQRNKDHRTKLGKGQSSVGKCSGRLEKRGQERGGCRVRGNAWRGGVTRAQEELHT